MATPMYILTLVGLATIIAFSLFSFACGLYYISQAVEEHPRISKKIIRTVTLVIVVLQLIMVPTENFPLLQTAISLIFFFIYDLNSRTFPFTTVYSLPFIGSCVSIVCHHFMWFYYFIHTPHNYSFTAVVSFMLICVWAVPFSYFVSLSTTDIALLDSAAPAPGNARHRKRTNLFRSLLGFLERSGKQPDNFDTDIDGRDAGPDRTLSASSRPFSSAWDQKLE